MSVAVASKCLCCLILLSLVTTEAQSPIRKARPLAASSVPLGSVLRSAGRVGNVHVGSTMGTNIRPSVLRAAAFSEAVVPQDLDLAPLALLGSALFVLGRLLRKFADQPKPEIKSKPEVRGVAGEAA